MHLQRGDVVGACERKLDQRLSQELLPYALDQVFDEGMDRWLAAHRIATQNARAIMPPKHCGIILVAMETVLVLVAMETVQRDSGL